MQVPISLRSTPTAANPIIVDREAGIIFGVSVIAAGQTQPSGGGHAPFNIDGITLTQVAAAINANPIGVKSRITHPEINGDDDLPRRLGYVRNARVTGRTVRADMHFHNPQSSEAITLMSIAESDPASCGLSIVAETAVVEVDHNGRPVLRVDQLDAIDFVGEPAANPAGMLGLSASTHNHTFEDQTMPSITYNGPDAATAMRDAQDAMLVRLGCPIVAFDEQNKPIADATGAPRVRRPSREALELASESLIDIGATYLRRVGSQSARLALSKMNRPDLAKMLLSRPALSRHFPHLPLTNRVLLEATTGDYPSLLADTLNKAVLSHYALARRSWRAWARRGTVKDFKQADRIRLEDSPALEKLEPGQAIEFATLPENPREQFSIATYARGLKFTRQAMLNDDSEQLRVIGEVLAAGAFRLEDVLAYNVLADNAAMADNEALFSTAHQNTIIGALTTTTLGEAAAKIAGRTNASGDVLDLQAARLIVPTTLKATGESVLHDTANAARHEFEDRIKLISSAHLDTDSTTQWYLATDPARQAPVEVAFIEGQDQPFVDSDSHFDSDGLLFKVRHDLAAKSIDYRAIVRSSGA